MRYLANDPTRQDPRALLTAEKMANLTNIVAPVQQYITATGTNELAVSADCIVTIGGGGVFNTSATMLNAANLDTGAGFAAGKDYYVYLCDPGSGQDERYVISLNSTYPNGYAAYNSRKIGGFHYGKCRNVNAKLQPVDASNTVRGTGWESNVFDGIVPRSVWTLAHRPKCAPEGMVYLGGGTWVDIYLSSDNGAGGLASINNVMPITGTEGLTWYGFTERALVSGKRLMTYSEWCAAALGSPQGNDDDNTNAWSMTTNTGRNLTGGVANAVSSIGCRDCVGNVNENLNEFIHDPNGTTGNWHDVFPGYGKVYMYSDKGLRSVCAGGFWNNGVSAGARTANLATQPWGPAGSVGVRCVCDSL